MLLNYGHTGIRYRTTFLIWNSSYEIAFTTPYFSTIPSHIFRNPSPVYASHHVIVIISISEYLPTTQANGFLPL